LPHIPRPCALGGLSQDSGNREDYFTPDARFCARGGDWRFFELVSPIQGNPLSPPPSEWVGCWSTAVVKEIFFHRGCYRFQSIEISQGERWVWTGGRGYCLRPPTPPLAPSSPTTGSPPSGSYNPAVSFPPYTLSSRRRTPDAQTFLPQYLRVTCCTRTTVSEEPPLWAQFGWPYQTTSLPRQRLLLPCLCCSSGHRKRLFSSLCSFQPCRPIDQRGFPLCPLSYCFVPVGVGNHIIPFPL